MCVCVYHYTPIRMAKIKKIIPPPKAVATISNTADDADRLDQSYVAGMNAKCYSC